MKVLGLQGYFLLSDEFEGDFADAIQQMADYHRTVGMHRPDRKVTDGDINISNQEIWREFWGMVHSGTRRLSMQVSISEYDPETKQMHKLAVT